ncbi:MAG TPA: DUF1707 domain-containing protein [Pseudonocardiaceae bacterium]
MTDQQQGAHHEPSSPAEPAAADRVAPAPDGAVSEQPPPSSPPAPASPAPTTANAGTPAPISPRDLRVSDAEREHVVELLQKATGRGLLDLDEFTRRADAALAATTRAELNSVLIDLPGLVNREELTQQFAPPETVELNNSGSSVVRTGHWVVPRRVVLRGAFCNHVLDLTQADIRHPVVTIEVDASFSNVRILLPPGATASTHEVSASGSSVRNRADGAPRAGELHVVVRGELRGSNLVVTRPRTLVRLGRRTIQYPWRVVRDE